MANILVIDDDAEIRNFLSTVLGHAGHLVVPSRWAVEAVELIPEHRIDLVIVDIFMPQQDGLETIRKLRRDHPETKIIAISGGGSYGQLEYLNTALKLGAHASLEKPLGVDSTVERVAEVLKA